MEQLRSQSLPAGSSRSLECAGQQIFTEPICAGDRLEPEEQRLYDAVNRYRAEHGLPPIPLSPSLTVVANRRVLDLHKNIGHLTHSWSNCPYDAANPATYPCMWKAPQRLGTAYPGNGYEVAHGRSGRYRATANLALQAWQRSPAHNAVILNQGIWQVKEWRALGIGISNGFALLWFGEERDPAQSPN